MLSISQHFSKHGSFHLSGEFVMGLILEDLYKQAVHRWKVTFGGADC
jgi:hypothetical protein